MKNYFLTLNDIENEKKCVLTKYISNDNSLNIKNNAISIDSESEDYCRIQNIIKLQKIIEDLNKINIDEIETLFLGVDLDNTEDNLNYICFNHKNSSLSSKINIIKLLGDGLEEFSMASDYGVLSIIGFSILVNIYKLSEFISNGLEDSNFDNVIPNDHDLHNIFEQYYELLQNTFNYNLLLYDQLLNFPEDQIENTLITLLFKYDFGKIKTICSVLSNLKISNSELDLNKYKFFNSNKFYIFNIQDSDIVANISTLNANKYSNFELNSKKDNFNKKEFIINYLDSLIIKLKNKELNNINMLTLLYCVKDKNNDFSPVFYNYSSVNYDNSFKLNYYNLLIKTIFHHYLNMMDIGNIFILLLQLVPNSKMHFNRIKQIINSKSDIEKTLFDSKIKINRKKFNEKCSEFPIHLLNILNSNQMKIGFEDILKTQLLLDLSKDSNLLYSKVNSFVFAIYILIPRLYDYSYNFANTVSKEHANYMINELSKIDFSDLADIKKLKNNLHIIYSLAYDVFDDIHDEFDSFNIIIPDC